MCSLSEALNEHVISTTQDRSLMEILGVFLLQTDGYGVFRLPGVHEAMLYWPPWEIASKVLSSPRYVREYHEGLVKRAEFLARVLTVFGHDEDGAFVLGCVNRRLAEWHVTSNRFSKP